MIITYYKYNYVHLMATTLLFLFYLVFSVLFWLPRVNPVHPSTPLYINLERNAVLHFVTLLLILRNDERNSITNKAHEYAEGALTVMWV
jgi:hypothetical protein